MNFTKNQHINIKITDLGNEGQGIGKADGFTFFVPGALPDETVEMRIIKLKTSYGYGKLVKILEPSKDRVEPFCKHFPVCGGCALQHLDYNAQLKYKQNKVYQTLLRIGKTDVSVEQTQGDDRLYYRNKASFPIGYSEDEQKAFGGFYRQRSHDIIPIEKCKLVNEKASLILKIFVSFINDERISAYDEQSHTGLVRHIIVRTAEGTGETGLCVVINGKVLPKADSLAKRLQAVEGFVSLSVNQNTERTNVIMGKHTHTVWGSEYIRDKLCGLEFFISPKSFYQVNAKQAAYLYEKGLELLDIQPNDTIIDAYCGIGTLTLFSALKAQRSIGIESVLDAISDARKNAEHNKLENAEFIEGLTENILPKLLTELSDESLKLILDPPRQGVEKVVIEAIAASNIRSILYISCDPASLAKDIELLKSLSDFQIKKICPVDLFGHTGHIESAVLISRD